MLFNRKELVNLKGFVPTPKNIVDTMVNKLFDKNHPTADSDVLDPGCGTGVFIEGIIRWCESKKLQIPKITGVELNPEHISKAKKLEQYQSVTIIQKDFLISEKHHYNYIIGNPPYVSIINLTEQEKKCYREGFKTARHRFDLYLLFFEQALRLLEPDGRLVHGAPPRPHYALGV